MSFYILNPTYPWWLANIKLQFSIMVVLLSAFQVACPSYLEKQSFGIIGGSSTEGLIGNVNHNHNHNHTHPKNQIVLESIFRNTRLRRNEVKTMSVFLRSEKRKSRRQTFTNASGVWIWTLPTLVPLLVHPCLDVLEFCFVLFEEAEALGELACKWAGAWLLVVYFLPVTC